MAMSARPGENLKKTTEKTAAKKKGKNLHAPDYSNEHWFLSLKF